MSEKIYLSLITDQNTAFSANNKMFITVSSISNSIRKFLERRSLHIKIIS